MPYVNFLCESMGGIIVGCVLVMLLSNSRHTFSDILSSNYKSLSLFLSICSSYTILVVRFTSDNGATVRMKSRYSVINTRFNR